MAASSSALVRQIPPLPTVRDILKLYNLRAKKRLSQNFLLDQRICRKIVRAAGNLQNHHVLEVGPGPGSISRAILAANVRHLQTVEMDERFKPSLELLADTLPDRLSLHWGDILDYNLEQFFPSELAHQWDDKPPPINVIGNLPFSISTPLIIKWLRQISSRSGPFKYGRTKLTLTFQAEVAERLYANPCHVQRSRLSVMAQHLCRVDYKMVIPGSAFIPKPDVNVGVVTFTPWKVPKIKQNFNLVTKVVKTLFQHRQRHCIKGLCLLVPEKDMAERMIAEADLNKNARTYQLTMDEFSRLCDAYHNLITKYPEVENYHYR